MHTLPRHLNDAHARGGESLASLPDVDAIGAIIETAFWASLRREEGYVPRISLAFVAPEQAAQPLRFGHPLPLEAAALTRVAPAVAPAGIHLGVWRDAQRSVGVGHGPGAAATLFRARSGGARPSRRETPAGRRPRKIRQRRRRRGRPNQGHRRACVDVARLPTAPDVAARLRRAELVDRFGQRPRAARGRDARAWTRRFAADGLVGERRVARVDRAADVVRRRAPVSRAGPAGSRASGWRAPASVARSARRGRQRRRKPDGGRWRHRA